VRRRFPAEIKERRSPHTAATVDQLPDRYQGGSRTVTGYREYVDKHVRPFVGRCKVGDLDTDILDSLHPEMRRCRDHCTSRFGHGGGGTTTFRVYTAWVAEAEQCAAQGFTDRLPARPAPVATNDAERARTDPRSPYERVAVELQAAWTPGRSRSAI
jgi:hypothetical protein